MPTVNDILRTKGQSLVTVGVDATALEAVHVMNDHRVGAVLVMDRDQIAGIFTERDVLRRVVAGDLSPRDLPVRDVMTQEVLCSDIFTDLDEVAHIMQSQRIRHLPVRDVSGRIVGMISIGDVNAFHVTQKQATIESMTNYICGRS
jgi:CBS domain-containing protein